MTVSERHQDNLDRGCASHMTSFSCGIYDAQRNQLVFVEAATPAGLVKQTLTELHKALLGKGLIVVDPVEPARRPTPATSRKPTRTSAPRITHSSPLLPYGG